MSSYTEGMVGQPVSFLPHQSASQIDRTISELLFRGLFKYDLFGNLVPDLAESWSISSDGLVYTVTLKEDQKWTDGSTITADDVIYTAFKTPNLQGVGTDKVDSRTVRFILPNRFSPFLDLLVTGVMKDNSEDFANPLQPPSSGEFRVLDVEENGPIIRQVTLISESDEANFRKLVFRYYSNDDELVTASKLGEIDAFTTNSIHDIENFTNHKFPLQGVYFAIFFNLEDETVDDLALRQNLQKVIDIEKIIFDKGIFVEGPISRSRFTDYDLEFNPYDEDLRLNLGTDLTLTIPDLKQHVEMARRLTDIWEDVLGVDVKVEARNAETFVEDVIEKRDYQMLLYGQEISRDPGRYVNWHSTQRQHPGLNLSNFSHVRADRALEEGRKEIDNDRRVVHYNEFQKVLVEQVPAIFLYHPYKNYYVSQYIQGIGEKYTFTVSDRFLDFNNWERISTN